MQSTAPVWHCAILYVKNYVLDILKQLSERGQDNETEK